MRSKSIKNKLQKFSLNRGYELLVFYFGILFFLSSCEEFLDIGAPRTRLVTPTVFSTNAAAISAINGIYYTMQEDSYFASGKPSSLTFIGGLSSDEFDDYSADASYGSFNSNSLLPTNQIVGGNWADIYKYIYYVNSILDGVSNSTEMTSEVKKQLEGEAKFIRAFCHFYAVNMFGDVPLVTETDYRLNSNILRTTTDQVYEQIIEDLIDSQTLMVDDYSLFNNERVRPNKWAATALLARVYLYTGNWMEAEIAATSLISNSSEFSLLSDLNSVFLKNSHEAIWQLMPHDPSHNTNEGFFFEIVGTPAHVAISDNLLGAFEANDERRAAWVDSTSIDENTYYFPYKYKIGSGVPGVEYSMILRVAEQYLIRAEARCQQDNLTGAISDVDTIRQRAGLMPIQVMNPNISKSDLLLVIEQERRIELFSEMGHRWFDLKRTDRTDAILGPIKSD